jgi:long-chain fatty acid transport protein
MGKLSDAVTIGAAYAPKMSMSAFDSYKGLFEGGGKFDIPAHYSVGAAFAATPAVTIALDYEHIAYSGVPSVGNPSSVQLPLGATGGPGFGWKDVNVFKLGVQWRASDAWTVRAGYNHGNNPIDAADVTFNILAPGVMQDHYTAGFTWAMDPKNEISGSLMVAPRQSVTGASLFNAVLGAGAGGNETIRMRQTAIGLAWGHKF